MGHHYESLQVGYLPAFFLYMKGDCMKILITNDDGVMKKILLKGRGEKPKNGDIVKIK